MKKFVFILLLLMVLVKANPDCNKESYWPQIGCTAEGTFCVFCPYGNYMPFQGMDGTDAITACQHTAPQPQPTGDPEGVMWAPYYDGKTFAQEGISACDANGCPNQDMCNDYAQYVAADTCATTQRPCLGSTALTQYQIFADQDVYDRKIKPIAATSNLISTQTAATDVACLDLCDADISCLGAAYEAATQTCHLRSQNVRSIYPVTTPNIAAPGINFYQKVNAADPTIQTVAGYECDDNRPMCNPETKCNEFANKLKARDLQAAGLQAPDPHPNHVFFINSGVVELLPEDRDFLWAGQSFDGMNSCPPKDCEVRTSTNFDSGCDIGTAPLSTCPPSNGMPECTKYGILTFDTTAGVNPTFSDGIYLCMECSYAKPGQREVSDVIKVYFVSCYEDQWKWESKHMTFFNQANGVGFNFNNVRNIWYLMNTGDAGASPHTFTRTVTDMMEHKTLQWASYPEWNCVWQQNCRVVRDTSVVVAAAPDNTAGAYHGDDFNHGTWNVADGWITTNPTFVPVPEVQMFNIGPDNYRFEVDTTTPYYYDGLYVECDAGDVGQTGYLTQYTSIQGPYNMDNMSTTKRYMGPILIQILEDTCGYCLDLSDPAPPNLYGNEYGNFHEDLTWYQQTVDVVFPRSPVPNIETFDFENTYSTPAISMYNNDGLGNGDLSQSLTYFSYTINGDVINTEPVRCPHLRWEAFSDPTMAPATVLADPDIVFSNGNDPLLAKFDIQTDTAKCDEVYLNTYTYGRTTDCLQDVNFNTNTADGMDTKAPAPNGIVLRIVVCGNEQLSLTAAGMVPILEYLPNESAGTTSYVYDYKSWFDLTVGPCSHPSCGIQRYYLGGCYTPGYAGIEYNDPTIHQVSMPSTLANDPLATVTLVNNPVTMTRVCMWAETFGGAKLARPLDYEICGTEGVTLVPPDNYLHERLYRDEDLVYPDGRHKYVDLDGYETQFVSNSPNCPIREWTLFDTDGVTPLVDQQQFKITKPNGQQIAVNTETFNWMETIYYKNKVLNPLGICNWECYRTNHPVEVGAMNWEEMHFYYYNTGQALGQKCTCDEIQSIAVTVHVDKCNLVGTNHNCKMPTDPLNTGYLQGTCPYWFIREPTTWKPTANHPSYWIDKFYPVNPPASYDKNLKERFISEDEINCPNLRWMIAKVVDSSTGLEIPQSTWNQYLRINEATGDFTVDDFSNRFINSWQVHFETLNEYHTTGVSDHHVVELVVYEPFIPENKDPYFKTWTSSDATHAYTAYENRTWYDDPGLHPLSRDETFYLPDVYDPEGEYTAVYIEDPQNLPDWVTYEYETVTNPDGTQTYKPFFHINKQLIPQDDLKAASTFFLPIRLKMQDYYGMMKSEPGHDDNAVYYEFRISITVDQNMPPRFKDPPMINQTIVVYENAEWYDYPELYYDKNYYNYTFPGFYDFENETVYQSMGHSENLWKYGYHPDYMTWDEERKTLMWDKKKISRINELGDEYYMPNRIVPVDLVDDYGNVVTYLFNFKIIWIPEWDPYGDNDKRFRANITEISDTGLVKVMFNLPIENRWFNITRHKNYSSYEFWNTRGRILQQDLSKWDRQRKFPRPPDNYLNVSDLNSSHLEMFIIPRNDRHKQTGFELEWLNFTWEAVFFEYNFLLIQCYFNEPLEISTMPEWDTFYLRFYEEHMSLWFTPILEVNLDPDHWELWHPVPPQFGYRWPHVDFLKELTKKTYIILLGLFWVCLFLNLIFARSMIRYITLLRTLQIILHLPMLKIVVPTCVIYTYSYIFPIIQWDIFRDGLFDTRNWFDFDEKTLDDNPIMDQMRMLGYKSRNIVGNMGSISIFWFLYFLKILSLIFMKCFKVWNRQAASKSENFKKIYNIIFKQCFFQEFFLIIISTYFEYLVAGYLFYDRVKVEDIDELNPLYEQQKNRKLQETQLVMGTQEIINTGFMYFCFVVALILTPLAFGYVLTQNINMYQQAKFKVRWGSMFEGVKLRSKIHAAFYLIFIIRRVVFVMLCFGWDNYSGLNLCMIEYFNLFMLMYVGYTRPLISKFSNRLEMFNELFVCYITFHMKFFSSWVLDENNVENKPLMYDYGIMMNTFFFYYLYCNIIVIIWETLKLIRLLILYLYTWIRWHLYALGPFKLPDDCNIIYEDKEIDPIDLLVKQKKQKPVLFIQWYTDIIEQESPQERPPDKIVFRPLPPLPKKVKKKVKIKELSVIKEEDTTINQEIDPIPVAKKNLTAFSKFMNEDEGGDFRIIQGKPVDVAITKSVKPLIERPTLEPSPLTLNLLERAKMDSSEKKKSEKKKKEKKNDDGKDDEIKKLKDQVKKLQADLDEHQSTGRSTVIKDSSRQTLITKTDFLHKMNSSSRGKFGQFMEEIQEGQSQAGSRPVSRALSTFSRGQQRLKGIERQDTSNHQNEPPSDSFFTIMTRQQDHQGLVDQKQELNEVEDKLTKKFEAMQAAKQIQKPASRQ